MAITAADIKVKFSSENADVVKKDIDSVGDSTESLSQRLTGAGQKMTLFATTPILGFMTKAFMGAAGLEQAFGKTEAVFGNATDSVIAWSQNSADAFGLSQSEALAMVSTYGAILNAQGVAADTSKAYSQDLIQLSADMAAFNDVSTDRAGVALRGALTGEYEALKSLGVVMTAAEVDTRALAIATAEGRDEITEADKVMARYQILMEKTSQQQGSFAAEADGASGSMAIFQAHLKDAANNIGRHLLPAGTKLIRKLTDLAKWVDGLSDTQQKWVIGIGLAVAAIGPLLIALGAFGPMLATGAAMLGVFLSPLGLVIAGIAALAAGAIYAYQNFEPFREAVDKVAAALKDFAADALEKVIAGWNKLKEAFDAEGWSGVWDTIVQAAQDGLRNILDAIRNFDWGSAWNALVSAAQTAIGWVLDAIRNVDWGALIQGGWDILYQGLQLAWEAVKDIPWESIIGKIADFSSWLAGQISDIPWPTIIGKIADFATWLSGKVSDIPWSTIVGKIADFSVWLGEKISDIPWATIIGKLEDFGTWLAGQVSDIPWATIIGKLADFGVWLADQVSDIPWATLIGKIGDFATWLGGQISDIPWSTIIGKIADFGSWLAGRVSAVTWSEFIPDITWSNFIPSLSWPTKDEILNAITFGIVGEGGNPYQDIGVSGEGVDPNDPSTWNPGGGKQPFFGGNLSETGMGPGAGGGFGDFGVAAAIAALATLRSALETTQGSVTTFVSSTVGVMGGWTTGLQTMLGTVASALISKVGTATSTAQSSVVSFVSSTIGVMGGWTSGIQTMVNTTMSTMQSRTSSGTSSAKNSFVSFVSQVIGVMGGWSTGITNTVNGAVSQMVSRANSGGQQMTSAFRNGAQNAASAVRSALSAIPGIVASVGGSAASAAYSVGANIGQSMAAGMRSALGAISAAANQMVAEADRAVRARARIASPSKLFAGLGEYLGEGFEQGIRSMIPDVARATAALVHTPSMPAYGNYGMPAHAYAGARGTTITNTYGDIVIHQQPGEDGEALATRVISLLNQAENLAGVH